MADWAGTSRTNYFAVQDSAAFEAAVRDLEVRVATDSSSGQTKYALFAETDGGDWPRIGPDEDDVEELARVVRQDFTEAAASPTLERARELVKAWCENNDDGACKATREAAAHSIAGVEQPEEDFFSYIAPHLADGEILVGMTIGSEKSRYLTGYAVAIDRTGKEVSINLDNIYALARDAFGREPAPCTY